MQNLFTLPYVIWLGLALVVVLVLVHIVALKLIGIHFRKKYPEAFKDAEQNIKATKDGMDASDSTGSGR